MILVFANMFEALKSFFDSTLFMPHGHCYLWKPEVLWLNVLSDIAIAIAYFSIPIALVVFVKRRSDLAFNWIFRMFAVFIAACGTTHLIEVWTVWNPDYAVQGIVKFYTAIVSCATAFMLWPLMPRALALPSPSLLQAANDKLAKEIEERAKIELELMDAKRNLEMRVEQRTAELRRANKMKDEFLSTLSHELRTPLNVIMGYADLLSIEEPNTPPFTQAIESIMRNARVQGDLINDLLDVSRIITGKIQLDNQLVDPVNLIECAIEAVRLSAEVKQLTIDVKFADMTGFILGDATRLQQVLWNLLANAVKFSNKGGVITVTTERIDSKLEMRVRDEGLGIDPEFLPYVFDRFRQEDSSNTRGYGGLGLGLAIVRHIIELHGGMVFAESRGRGTGATFIINLPVMSAPPRYADKTPSRSIPTSLGNSPFGEHNKVLRHFKILIVEDEEDTRILLRSILMRAGADVKAAETASEGRDLLKGWLPDVIVSDIGMRDENGYEFVRKLRADQSRPESKVPAVALTAYARNEDREQAMQAGFQGHAAKPITAPHLIEIILRVLPKPKDS